MNGKKIVKWLIRTGFAFLCLVLLVVILLYMPPVQQLLTRRLAGELSEKLKTEVGIGSLRLNLFGNLVLEEIFMRDQQGDTLIYTEDIELDISMLRLLNKTLHVSQLEVEGLRSMIMIDPETKYANYNFITEAFSASEKEKDPGKKSAWEITFGNIFFKRIFLDLDVINQMDLHLALGELDLKSNFTDLQKFTFHLDQIRVARTTIDLIRPEKETMETDESGTVMDSNQEEIISFITTAGKISLDNIHLRMREGSETDLDVSIGTFDLKKGSFDQRTGNMSAGSLTFHDSRINYLVLDLPDTTGVPETEPDEKSAGLFDSLPWKIDVKNIDLKRIFLSMHHTYVPDTSLSLDPRHVEIRDLRLVAENTVVNQQEGHTLVSDFGFSEGRGFNLNSFSAEFSTDSDLLEIKGLELATDHSRIKLDLLAGSGILDRKDRPGSIQPLEMKIKNSRIGMQDLEYLLGKDNMPVNGFQAIQLEVETSGTLNDIRLGRLDLLVDDQTRFSSNGSVRNILNPGKLSMDMRISDFFSSKDQLVQFIPGLDSFDTYMPDTILMTGTIHGSLTDINTAIGLTTSKGDLHIEAFYKEQGLNDNDTLGVDFVLKDYDISQIFQNDSLELLTAIGRFGTSGIRNRNLSISSDLEISLEVANKQLDKLHINGFYGREMAFAKIVCNDPILDLDITTEASFRDTIMNYDIAARIGAIDLYTPGFIKNPFIISTRIGSSGRMNGETLKGNLLVDTLQFSGSERYTINKIRSDFLFSPDSNSIVLESDNVSAILSGNMPFGEIPDRINGFFKRTVRFSEGLEIADPAMLSLNIHFKEPMYQLSRYIQDLDTVYLEQISLIFDEKNGYLNAEMNIPDFQYKNYLWDSLKLNFLADGQDINYQLVLNRFSSNSFYFTDLIFSGQSEDSVLYNRIQKVDSTGNDLYFIGINLFRSQDGLEINLLDDKLVLNGHNWNTIKGSGLLVDTEKQLNGKIGIMRGTEKIVAGVDHGSSFFLEMDNFDLATFSELIGYVKDSLVLEGKVDLDASVQLSDSIPDIDADVSIAGLTYNQMHLGDIHMEVINSHEEKVSFRATLENEGNRIGLNGYYAQADPSPLLIDLDIDISSLSAFESFAMGKLDQLEGQVRGEIQLAGDLKDLSVNGVLDLNKVGVFSRQLNNKYYIEKESLKFINKDLSLNGFTIKDSLNNDFSINGTIGYLIPEKSPVNLQIRADKFTVYNAREKESPSLYGKMIISMDAKATGNLQDPKLSVKLAIEPETDMTFVRPPKEINLVSYEDIIEFRDPENPDTVSLSKDMDLALPDSIRSRFEGYEMVANLSIHEGAAFRLVIDPNSGDYVSIKGKGDLNIQVKEGADPLLSGVYEVREGIYQVSFYGLVQKSFNILNGSTIIWAGDPMNARMNLIASHILRTSSTGLVAAETVGLSDEQLNQYRRALPYEVKILIAGTFRQPELNFEINLVDENRAAYPLVISKLSQINGEGYESLLTQQVFGLLTIGSFIPEQTFDSGSGNSGSALATTAAANSLNGILAGEFNKLSGKYLKGVNLDIGLQSYSQMSSGDASTQTAMDVKFSKNLFDDRVTIEAQTTFDVGGDNYTDPTGYDYSNFHSDFAIKYDLTPKGDYKLKAFNRSSFDIIYKDIWSTGIAIIFVKEFDKLSETRKNRKDKQKQEE